MGDLTTYLERGLETEIENAGGFYAYYDGPEPPYRALGDAIYEESRHLLAATSPRDTTDYRYSVLVIPHEEAGTVREAMELLPETIEITRKVPGSYQGTEPPTETLTYTLYAIRPTETSVSYEQAMEGH